MQLQYQSGQAPSLLTLVPRDRTTFTRTRAIRGCPHGEHDLVWAEGSINVMGIDGVLDTLSKVPLPPRL